MPNQRHADYNRAFSFAQRQVRATIERTGDFFPMYTQAGRWSHGGPKWTDWCGGFFAGMMWLFYQQTGDSWWRHQAEHYSRLLEHRKSDRDVHDLGFIFLNTYRRWYEAPGESALMDVVAEAGTTMSSRFQEKGQYLASFLGLQSLFIDIMMNVPLLFVTADWLEQSGARRAEGEEPESGTVSPLSAFSPPPSRLRRIATAHCLISQKYLVRPDGSTAHEAIFDTETGQFLRESTQQGLRADSCWSRGLAWSLYGFGTVYSLTRFESFLETAVRCADHFLARLPPAMVPPWDFDVPEGPDRIWDSSAAAIAASGLLQLADLTSDSSRSSAYRESAHRILDTLCSDQFLAIDTPGWEGILRHAVYHFHKKLGVDESVMWGDHFFVEALSRAMNNMRTT
jgi:unsaturated chondroitin disaccharide hydrolase